MNKKVGIRTKLTKTKTETYLSQKHNTNFSQRKNLPLGAGFDKPLFWQRNLGNQGIQCMMKSEVIQANPAIRRSIDYGSFTLSDLQQYLTYIDRENAIEDNNDSDDKARAITNAWKNGGSLFELNASLKALMIKEMQSGFTGDDDEQAILELLERSDNYELLNIFTSQGVSPSDLNSDFHGEEWEWLQNFYYRRFKGGMSSVLAGIIIPKGSPVPLGTPVPRQIVPPQAQAIAQTGEAACNDPQQRDLIDANNTCCTESMLNDINQLRNRAIPLVQNAVRKLATFPSDVSRQLRANFAIPDDDILKIHLIVNRLEITLNQLASNTTIRFVCNFWGDTVCRKHLGKNRVSQKHATTYLQHTPKLIRFCGDYFEAQEPGGQYLSDSHWLRTLIHEYHHVGGNLGSPTMYAEYEEYYKGVASDYPRSPSQAIRNPDCYAQFIMDVHEA